MTHDRVFLKRWGCALVFALALSSGSALASVTTIFSGSLADPSNAALVGSGVAPSPPDFTDDDAIANNVAIYVFKTGAAGTARFLSTGFASGGVDPYFSLFAGTGAGATFLLSNFDQAFSTGGDFDLSIVLPAGFYTVALGVFANMSFAENSGVGTLADGFIGFGDAFYLHNADYRLLVTTVPEPPAFPLFASLLLMLVGAHFAARHSRMRGSPNQS